jgi:hypothetical protein
MSFSSFENQRVLFNRRQKKEGGKKRLATIVDFPVISSSSSSFCVVHDARGLLAVP